MKKVLLVIDYQYDFVANDGKLTCGKAAQDIEKNLVEKIRQTVFDNQSVIFTKDNHNPRHWENTLEGKMFPLHCVEGTLGYDLFGEVERFEDRCVTLTKSTYMLCDSFLKFLVENFDEIEVCGLATNLCVLQNAIGLYNMANQMRKQTKFIVDKMCCASFDQKAHEDALQYMKNYLGFEMI